MADTDASGSIIMLDIPGSDKVSEAFKDKVMQIAADLGINPNFLMAVMSFETGGSFSPSVRNAAGSGAVGLIQFMPKTAKDLGTNTGALAKMTAEDQLDFVAKYLKPFKNRMKTIEDAYMAVLMPSAIGKGSNFVLFRKPSVGYNQNKGLDVDQDGLITVGEAADRVRKRLGDAATGTATGEILHRSMKGAEVERLQDELINLGYMTPAQKQGGAGSFGPVTEGALQHFQADNHLDANGTFDLPTQTAVRQINEGVKSGSTGPVVRGLQDRLVAVGGMTIAQVSTGLGTFGPQTEAALKTFQMQHGMNPPSGILTDETYRALLLAAPQAVHKPELSSSTSIDVVLPESGIGYKTYNREPGGADQIGRASTIRNVQHLGELWNAIHPDIVIGVGDISRRGGGNFPPHKTHKDGLDVDLRPLTNNGVNEPTNIGAANFSHGRTRELILLIRNSFAIEVIFFNDPLTINEGLTRHAAGHGNHVHVRFKA